MDTTTLNIALETARSALQLIAAPVRPDGTYNRDRRACELVAAQALQEVERLMAVKAPSEPVADEIPESGISVELPILDETMSLPQGTYTIYTDGGCHGNPGPAGVGISVVQGEDEVMAYGAYIGKATNQVAELSAAISGLRTVAEGSVVELVSDSQYVLKGLSEWRKGWIANGWTNSSGKPVANKPYWQELYALADKRKVTTRWVKGHNGDVFNERCDELANDAISRRNMDKMSEIGFLG